MPDLRRTARAEEDLMELWLYIAQDNLSAVKASQRPEAEAIRHLERSPQWVW